MSAYNEGDLVRATKGETVIQGRMSAQPGRTIVTEFGDFPLHNLEFKGFTVEVVEKAPEPKSVHEIGLEEAARKSFVRGDTHQRVFFKGGNGEWYEIENGWGNVAPTFRLASDGTMKLVAGWLGSTTLGVKLYPTEEN